MMIILGRRSLQPADPACSEVAITKVYDEETASLSHVGIGIFKVCIWNWE
jgi:hypothetical protein